MANLLIVIVISIIVVVLLIVIWHFLHKQREDWSELDYDRWQQRWRQIEKYLDSQDPLAWKMAVIEADNFLDNLLKIRGFTGRGLGDRLKFAQVKYKQLKEVWPAHILRNKLVHESDFTVSQRKAKSAVASFKKALKSLGYHWF